MRIAVLGSGGVGGYFGGRLAQAGQDVVFIARGQHQETMRDQGLRVESIKGDFHLESVQVTGNPSEVGEVDLVLVCVKAWQVTEAAEVMRPMVGSSTLVLPLQNGIEAPSRLSAVLGEDPVLGGLCGVMAQIDGPGRIRHFAIDPFIKFGELDNQRSDRVASLHQVLAQAKGFTSEIPEDIHVAMWVKFLSIVSQSGLGSVTRMPVGIYRSQSETRRLLVRVMQEVYEVGRAQGVQLPENIVSKALARIDMFPGSATASMQRDVMNGLPSELEAQTGAVVRLGRQVGVETPVNEFIYSSLLPMERHARGETQ